MLSELVHFALLLTEGVGKKLLSTAQQSYVDLFMFSHKCGKIFVRTV